MHPHESEVVVVVVALGGGSGGRQASTIGHLYRHKRPMVLRQPRVTDPAKIDDLKNAKNL